MSFKLNIYSDADTTLEPGPSKRTRSSVQRFYIFCNDNFFTFYIFNGALGSFQKCQGSDLK